MRRLIIEEPYSRTAVWSRRVAWFALAVASISIWLIRGERVDISIGFNLLIVGFGITMLAMFLAIAGFASVWREGRQGVARAGLAFAISIGILVWPAASMVRAVGLPKINDVTTDVDSPPAFSQSRAVLLARGGRVPPDPGADARSAQREAYPQVGPVLLDIPADEAYELALNVLKASGMQILESVAPGGRAGLGRIEAVDRTLLLRLADDVTVRIRPRVDGARIDIRSASRVGEHDLGANARRVRALAQAIAIEATQQR
jgi:uncharacterized protein (DUF1499 family)